MKTHNNFDERYEFTGSVKSWSLIAIVVGVIVIALGFITNNGERTFDNMLLMGYYLTCVCIGGIFFCAVQYAAQAGWSTSILRVPQAFGKVLPFAAVILLVIIIAGLSITHSGANEDVKTTVPYLYKRWATKGLTIKGNELYDALIFGKSGYLNVP